jgi:hypothetical protein
MIGCIVVGNVVPIPIATEGQMFHAGQKGDIGANEYDLPRHPSHGIDGLRLGGYLREAQDIGSQGG